MKRFVLLFLTFSMVMAFVPMLLVTAYSADASAKPFEQIQNAASYFCTYNEENGSVVISGTMNYDIVVKYKNCEIVVYKIEPQSSLEAVLKSNTAPIARSTMSIKFQFDVKVNSIIDKYSKYAVMICSTDNKLILTDFPQYISIPEKNEHTSEESSFKGIVNTGTSVGYDVNAKTFIIPVYLNQASSSVSKGYLYQGSFKQLYFDKNYIDDLDIKVRAATAMGAKVYLQFLLPSNSQKFLFDVEIGADAEYLMPNVYSEETLVFLDSFVSFILSRYDSVRNGMISGIILGKNIDLANKYNFSGKAALSEYAQCYSTYVAVVGYSARLLCPDIDMVFPFSDNNSFSDLNVDNSINSSNLLEALCKNFEESFSSEFSYNVMLESSLSPLNINTDPSDEKRFDLEVYTDKINANNVSDFSNYLQSLNSRYSSAPENYMYMWTVPEELMGRELAFVYCYSYYALVDEKQLNSFIVSFENNKNIEDIKHIVKYIDERNSLGVTEDILKDFGVESWKGIINSFDVSAITTHENIKGKIVSTDLSHFKGQYTYFKVNNISDINNWNKGINCLALSYDYSRFSENILKARFSVPTYNYECGEVYYVYDAQETFAFTPFLNFNLFIENDNGIDSVYAVKMTLFGDRNYMEAETSVQSGVFTDLTVDISDFCKENAVQSIKISVKEITGNNSEFSLYLKDITGFSEEYTFDELQSLIYDEHMKNQPPANMWSNINIGWILGGVLVAFSLCIGLYMFLKKDSDYKK